MGSSIVREFMFNVHFQVPLPQEFLRSFGLLAALSTSHKKEGGQQNEERRGKTKKGRQKRTRRPTTIIIIDKRPRETDNPETRRKGRPLKPQDSY